MNKIPDNISCVRIRCEKILLNGQRLQLVFDIANHKGIDTHTIYLDEGDYILMKNGSFDPQMDESIFDRR